MKTYARISNGIVAELFSTDGDIGQMFNPELLWVDVTTVNPMPQQDWTAMDSGGTWVFAAPIVVTESLAQSKAGLCLSIDEVADECYIAIGGPSPGRLAEYQQANTDATAFKAAGYAGTVPQTVQCWATASGMTAQVACDNILATATAWGSVLVGIRSARLIGKANVNAATTLADAHAAAVTAIANIKTAAGGA